MAKKYIVVNIGCLGCYVSSDVVGVFTNKEKADAIASACGDKYFGGSQNAFEVFELPEPEIINPEYNGINEVIK